MDIQQQLRGVVQRILSDIKVELGDEFDRNFTRQAFFSTAWQRRSGKYHSDKPLLIDTGQLRRSIKSRIEGNAITFYSSLPYADIHNQGGAIRVTARMKAYFWYRYSNATGAFGRKKDGSLRNDKRNVNLTTEAEFFKAMALMKEGRIIKIPQRQFLGTSPEVEKIVTDIIEENLNEYFENEYQETITKNLKK